MVMNRTSRHTRYSGCKANLRNSFLYSIQTRTLHDRICNIFSKITTRGTAVNGTSVYMFNQSDVVYKVDSVRITASRKIIHKGKHSITIHAVRSFACTEKLSLTRRFEQSSLRGQIYFRNKHFGLKSCQRVKYGAHLGSNRLRLVLTVYHT